MPNKLKTEWSKIPKDKPRAIKRPICLPYRDVFCTTKAKSGPGLNKPTKWTRANVVKIVNSFILKL